MGHEWAQRWPDLRGPASQFEAWRVEKHLAVEAPERLAELYLAWSCAHGDPRALSVLDTEFMPHVAQAVRRFGDADFVGEVCQQVRQRLLVAEKGAPKIGEFKGQGSLLKFLQAVAVRTALNQVGSASARGTHDDDAILDLPGNANDAPELLLMKSKYRAEFKQAFGAAMLELDDELRTALRLHYLDGLTLGDVSRLYGWSVPTACRRVAAARLTVLEATRRLLGDKLKLSPPELDSLLRLIESRLTIDTLHE